MFCHQHTQCLCRHEGGQARSIACRSLVHRCCSAACCLLVACLGRRCRESTMALLPPQGMQYPGCRRNYCTFHHAHAGGAIVASVCTSWLLSGSATRPRRKWNASLSCSGVKTTPSLRIAANEAGSSPMPSPAAMRASSTSCSAGSSRKQGVKLACANRVFAKSKKPGLASRLNQNSGLSLKLLRDGISADAPPGCRP